MACVFLHSRIRQHESGVREVPSGSFFGRFPSKLGPDITLDRRGSSYNKTIFWHAVGRTGVEGRTGERARQPAPGTWDSAVAGNRVSKDFFLACKRVRLSCWVLPVGCLPSGRQLRGLPDECGTRGVYLTGNTQYSTRPTYAT